MKKPWYLIEYEEKEYLHKKELRKKDFTNEYGDHRHCELCWNRFSIYEKDLHIGYYEPSSKSWICESCYNDFKDLFEWGVIL